MPDNGAGSYTLPQSPFVSGTSITSGAVNNNFSDIATALNNRLARNGENAPTANLPMGGFHHTGVGDATARNQYASAGQVQDGTMHAASVSTGSANAQAIDLTPGISAYAYGQRFSFVAGFSNTSAATLAVSGLTAKPLTRADGTAALSAADLTAGELVEVFYDGTSFRIIAPDARIAGVVDQIADAVDQIGWRQVSSTGWAAPVSGVIFTLPSENLRYRVEFQDVVPSAAAQLYIRFSVDGGATYLAGATDYGFATLESNTTTTGASGGSGGYMPVTPSTSSAVFGEIEFSPGPGGKVGLWRTQSYAAGPVLTSSSGSFFCSPSGTASHILIGFAGGNLSSGAARLLATTF